MNLSALTHLPLGRGTRGTKSATVSLIVTATIPPALIGEPRPPSARRTLARVGPDVLARLAIWSRAAAVRMRSMSTTPLPLAILRTTEYWW